MKHFRCDKAKLELLNREVNDKFLLDVDGEPLGTLPLEVEGREGRARGLRPRLISAPQALASRSKPLASHPESLASRPESLAYRPWSCLPTVGGRLAYRPRSLASLRTCRCSTP